MSNFDKNLLNYSNSDNIDKAIHEWAFIRRESRDERDGHCICNKKGLKHINYFFNIENKNMIESGDSCKKKLRLEKVDKKTLIIHKNLFDRITQGQPFEKIDYKEYIIKVYDHYIDYLQNDVSKRFELEEIRDIILNLRKLNLYKCKRIENLLDKIKEKKENMEREHNEKMEREVGRQREERRKRVLKKEKQINASKVIQRGFSDKIEKIREKIREKKQKIREERRKQNEYNVNVLKEEKEREAEKVEKLEKEKRMRKEAIDLALVMNNNDNNRPKNKITRYFKNNV